jgi:hypothetical protein
MRRRDTLSGVLSLRNQQGDGGAHAKPAHDWSSHGADAFRYFAVGFEEKTTTPLKIKPPRSRMAWMG